VRVPFLAMPNLLAGRCIIPEFIQHKAHPGNLSRTALEWLANPARLKEAQNDLAEVATCLGPPGAAVRASVHLHELLVASGG
jgi:lipid-A-disaccharide synthase